VPLALLALLLALPLIVALMMPFILLQRYRAGTTRRLARPWLAKLNVIAMIFSAGFFLLTAAISSFWIANAVQAAAIGLGIGCALGMVGVWVSRWEATPRDLHYTPNRWLVLFITLAVTARVAYGLWRAWMTVRADPNQSFMGAFGVAESLGVAAVVIGYYLAYGVGLQRRISRWEKRALRTME
jgi:hypothetical protein